MVTLTPDLAGNTIIIMGIVYVFTMLYSFYMAYLAYKQAKVKDLLQETNNILKRIEEKMSEEQ